jgi:hypothetical protein
MKNIIKAATVIYFCWPLFLSLHCVRLISHYLSYYKIGINAAANSWGLVFLEFPKLLICNYAMIFVIWNLANRFKWSRWWMLFAGVVASIGICTILVGWNIASYADYPAYKVQNLGEFMNYYIHHVILGRYL